MIPAARGGSEEHAVEPPALARKAELGRRRSICADGQGVGKRPCGHSMSKSRGECARYVGRQRAAGEINGPCVPADRRNRDN